MSKILIILATLLVLLWLLYPDRSEITNAPISLEKVVCFGESLTYGTGAPKALSYPEQLSRKLGIEIINAGIPGDTTVTALKRIGTVTKLNPTLVLITLGGNDLKNGVNKKQAFSNLKQIITTLQSRGAAVVIGGIDIPLFDRGFYEGYQQLAKETGSLLIPNIFEDIFTDRTLMSDQIHPNAKGYAIMAEHFYQVITPYL